MSSKSAATPEVGFRTPDGLAVPALSADQMREVDRIAVEDFGLGVLQMMENAGRNLALHAMEMLGGATGSFAVLAGSGGNGGGGISCARHLHNRGLEVHLLLTKDPGQLRGPARDQYRILRTAGLRASSIDQAKALIGGANLTIDALLGYSLKGAPRGTTLTLIEACNEHAQRVLSLDLPSGFDATSGDRPGACVTPDRTLTLALPKLGLRDIPGELYLADIGIPPEVYHPLGVNFEPFFGDGYWIELRQMTSGAQAKGA